MTVISRRGAVYNDPVTIVQLLDLKISIELREMIGIIFAHLQETFRSS